MFEKFSRSWSLVKYSAGVLRQDRELLVFPLLSTIAAVLVALTFVPLLMQTGIATEDGATKASPGGYAVMFALYLVEYFVIFFFNAALVGAALITRWGYGLMKETSGVLLLLGVPLGVFYAQRERERLTADLDRDASVIATLYEDALEAGDTLVALFFRCGDMLSDLVRMSREREDIDPDLYAPLIAELAECAGISLEEEEAEVDPDTLTETRTFLIHLARRRDIDETPAALSEAAGQLAQGILGKADAVRLWVSGARMPLPADFSEGEEAWRTVMALTNPVHRVREAHAAEEEDRDQRAGDLPHRLAGGLLRRQTLLGHDAFDVFDDHDADVDDGAHR